MLKILSICSGVVILGLLTICVLEVVYPNIDDQLIEIENIKDKKESFKRLKELAQTTHYEYASYLLGNYYFEGIGTDEQIKTLNWL